MIICTVLPARRSDVCAGAGVAADAASSAAQPIRFTKSVSMLSLPRRVGRDTAQA
jgi:hypothetical protein